MNKKGKLSSGKEWEVVPSRESSVSEGNHWILHMVGDLPLTDEEVKELLGIGYEFAEKHAITPGRYRIAMNGPGQRTQATVHIHLIFPVGKDKLPRLVWNPKDPIIYGG